MKIGKLIIERKTGEELAREYRTGAAAIRKGGLGRIGKHEADRADRKAERLERGGK